jgi:hypothetical protein
MGRAEGVQAFPDLKKRWGGDEGWSWWVVEVMVVSIGC